MGLPIVEGEPKYGGNDIVVVQTAFLGDALLGIPLLKNLRDANSNGKLVLLCRKGVGSFFRDAKLVDEVIEVDKSVSGGWDAAFAQLADRHFELLICPHQSFRTALFVAKMNARIKIGYRRFFNRFIFTHRVRRALDLPEGLRQLALLEPLNSSWSSLLTDFSSRQSAPGGQGVNGSLTSVPSVADMSVARLHALRVARSRRDLPSDLSPMIEPFFLAEESLIILAPGSVWPTKMWTKSGFIETGRALAASRGAIIIVVGSKDERFVCEEIANSIPNAVSLAGRTSLYESAQLMAIADLLICNDSGSMHLGTAAGVPVVSVFGPTVLELGYRPWSNQATVVQTDLVCRPCGKHGANRCPLGTHDCMKKIKAADVLTAAQSVAPTNPASNPAH